MTQTVTMIACVECDDVIKMWHFFFMSLSTMGTMMQCYFWAYQYILKTSKYAIHTHIDLRTSLLLMFKIHFHSFWGYRVKDIWVVRLFDIIMNKNRS